MYQKHKRTHVFTLVVLIWIYQCYQDKLPDGDILRGSSIPYIPWEKQQQSSKLLFEFLPENINLYNL